jgi:glutamine amidotransferase
VCDYGGPVVAAVEDGALWATQFHPEKSGANGLRILANFVDRATAAAEAA